MNGRAPWSLATPTSPSISRARFHGCGIDGVFEPAFAPAFVAPTSPTIRTTPFSPRTRGAATCFQTRPPAALSGRDDDGYRRAQAGDAIRKDEDRFVRADGGVQWLRGECAHGRNRTARSSATAGWTTKCHREVSPRRRRTRRRCAMPTSACAP